MPSNTTLDAGSGGDSIVTRQITHDGDTAKLPGSFIMAISGTEDSYTAAAIGGDAANGLDVDVTRVSGTVTVDNGGTFAVQAAQSGTWNITNISGTVSLPTGAATSANQTTIIGHVDGIETLLGTIDTDTGSIATDAGTIAAGFATEGSALGSGVLLQGDDGTDRTNVLVDTDGHLQIDVLTSALPSGASTSANQTTIIGHLDGVEGLLTTIDADTGTLAGAVSGSEMQVDVVASLPAGTNNIGDVDVASVPRGTSHYRNIDANAEAEIKGSAGTLFWIHAVNRTSAIAYLHLYDATAANVTPGTTTPDFTFAVPTQGDTNGAGFNIAFNGGGHTFANGMTLVCTTTLDGSTGDPGTNGVIVNAGYA